MQTRNIGGDRLGSGKKMNVHLHGYERSTFNLSRVWRSTMAAGTLVPFISELMLPGDTWDITLDAKALTHPTVGPLFGSYKMQVDVFTAPIRLYNALLHNNMLKVGLDIKKVKFPQISLGARPTIEGTLDISNSQINPSCLLHYVGLKGIGMNKTSGTPVDRSFNAIPILMYWEIYKNYYANKSEEIGAVIHTPAVAINETVDTIEMFSPPSTTTGIPEAPATTSFALINGSMLIINFTPPALAPIPSQILVNTIEHGQVSLQELAAVDFTTDGGEMTSPFRWTYWGNTTVTSWQYINDQTINTGRPGITVFPLDNIDEMRMQILAQDPDIAFDIRNTILEPYTFLFQTPNGIPNILSSQEGLGLKTYQSDIFQNWIQTEWIDDISDATRVDTTPGYLELDALNIAKKVYNYLNRVAVSGGSFNDWIAVTYDTNRYTQAENPMYMGGLSKELVFQEVVSNSAASADGQPLGTLAGKGTLADKHKGGQLTVKVEEPSYVMGIVSLTPRLDYSQGNKWDLHLQTLDDLYKPAMAQIGFQELITEQMAWFDTEWDNTGLTWVTKSAGKQPAWINYMTSYNETHGNFAIEDNEMFMTLNRRYEYDEDFGGIKDLTTYIDPSKFNNIFADEALDAQNFWIQIGIDIVGRRKISSKVMPNV